MLKEHMHNLERTVDPDQASKRIYDVVIIGAGVSARSWLKN